MAATDTVFGLARFEGRGAGSDAERRAARWLARELESSGRATDIETFWCRPNWALTYAWHASLGLAGSLISVAEPRVGGGLVLLALLSLAFDVIWGRSLGRRLTPEHASQNVASLASKDDERTRLIITANYDAVRTGLVYRDRLRRAARRMQRIAGGGSPGWLAWLVLTLLWALATAILRASGQTHGVVPITQLPPTVALVIATALLLELASSSYGPSAGDNASGAAVALALARALDTAPPKRLAVELVLQGASDGSGVGLRHHLRSRRALLRPANTVVLGIAPCGVGQPRWWLSDGSLVPLRYHARLRTLSAQLDVGAHRGRGITPAFIARLAGLPALTIGCLDERGLVPRSHTTADTAERVERGALDATLELALLLVDALDAELARGARG